MTRLLALALLLPLAACANTDAPTPEASGEATDTVASDATPVTAEMAVNSALQVDATAPDFTLPDVDGSDVQLSALLARGPVVLTFYRGAWCPYCNTQLRDYQKNIQDIEAAGATLVAISPQAPDSSITMQEQNELAFPVLSDVGGEVSDAYGLTFQVDAETRDRYRAVGVDLERYNGTDLWELPVPATYVIDASGVIRAAFIEADYSQRASVRQILDALAAV